jgi:hypothetical protein
VYFVEGDAVVISDKDVLGYIAPPAKARQSREPGVQALYEAASRLADIRRGAPKFRTRDLVGLLLSHGARTWRNSLPTADVRLRVFTPGGKAAVRMRFGQ